MPKAMAAMEGLTFGADPELFVVNPDGDFVSAAGLIPGTKEEPHKVDGGAVQVDGMAAEFNIEPVDNYKDWRANIMGVRKQLQEMLPNGYKLACVPTADFKPDHWFAAPDEAKVLGCSPDYDAWRKNVNPPPPALDFQRFAGGHIHVGWTQGADLSDTVYTNACIDLVRQFDWYLAAWSLKRDPDNRRRAQYGKAGAMRFKPYGVEYRTLSNFWLDTDKDSYILLETWNRMQAAIHDMQSSFMPVSYSNFNKKLIECINSSESSFFYTNFNYPVRSVN